MFTKLSELQLRPRLVRLLPATLTASLMFLSLLSLQRVNAQPNFAAPSRGERGSAVVERTVLAEPIQSVDVVSGKFIPINPLMWNPATEVTSAGPATQSVDPISGKVMPMSQNVWKPASESTRIAPPPMPPIQLPPIPDPIATKSMPGNPPTPPGAVQTVEATKPHVPIPVPAVPLFNMQEQTKVPLQPAPIEQPQPLILPGPGALPVAPINAAFEEAPKDGVKDKGPIVLPNPRPFPPFPPEQVRMPVLGDAEPLGTTPRPTQKELLEYSKYFDKFIDPRNTIDLIEFRSRIMILKDTPKRIQVSDETIVGYTQFPGKQLGREITLIGKQRGTTVIYMWFTNAEDKTKETILGYVVRVFPDPEAKERLERVYQALELEINRNFPDSFVKLKLVGDKVLVCGQAYDIEQASQILKVVVTNTPGAAKTPTPDITPTPRPDVLDPRRGATPGAENYLTSGSPNVINMLRVGGVQQVMLKVVVAEVNRTAARSIGMNFSFVNKSGIVPIENRTGGLVIPATGLGAGGAVASASGSGSGIGLANLPINLDNGQLSLAINALKKLSYAKSLAEPNLVTLNGQPATFLAGGQFPIPVVAGNGGTSLGGVSFVPFGVQLQFTPYVTDKDRIRLNVAATVSTRDTSIGTSISGSNVAGLNSRNFTSTVEMRDGETLAVAGLIQTNHGADRDQIPFLGTIPILNRLTGFDRTSAGEQELVILITPELVQPMKHNQVPRLPGSDLFEASDLEFYLLGRLEGRRPVDYRSQVMNDFHRIQQYNQVEQQYIFGPNGFNQINPAAPAPK